MGSYFEPVLTEEQMAAYLDGMLSVEENNMVEDLISSSPEMEEILDVIDSVDSSFIYEYDTEIPLECMVDDFSLPDIDFDDIHSDEYDDGEVYDEYDDEHHEWHYQDDSLVTDQEDSSIEDEYDDMSV